METFKIILLTVAVCVQVTSQESTGDSSTQIPKPNITRNPTHKVLYRTETVTLHCEVPEGASEFQYDWYKDSTNLETDHQSNVTVKEGGKYECKAKNGTSESENSDAYTLTLQDLPEARVQSEWTEAFPDEKVSLQCVIPVDENWIYKWFKGSENVVSSDERSIKDNTLTLSVKSGHEGDYACQAELKGRTVTTAKSKIHLLKVYGSKPTVVLKQDPSYPEIYTGEQVKLICSIKEETSEWQYQWQNHSVLVNNHTYTIPSATLDQNGEYTCKITRKEMTYTESTKLNISEPPRPKLSIESEWKTFYPTEKVTLKCSVDGGPNEWSYEWFKNRTQLSVDKDISFSENTLSISSAKAIHSGQYTCRGKHLTRTPVTTRQTESLQLHIYDIIRKPDITKHRWFDFFYTGEKVQLGCNMPGDGWKYDWYKDSKPLITDPTFTISPASLSDTGVYHCKAKRGDFSVDSEILRVQVQDPPQPKLSIESEWKTFYPTEKVILKCSIDGGSNEWSYEWFRNSTPISVDKDISFSGNTLSISSAKASHSGQYTCRGKHLTRTPVTTGQAEALQLHIYDNTPKPDITKHRWFDFFYTGEKVQLGCNMSGDGWKYDWYKGSKPLITDPTFNISSASLSDTGVYHCKAKRGDFSVDSETLRVQVQDLPEARVQSEWTEAFPDEKVFLQCVISVSENWIYKWFKGSENVVSSDERSIKDNTLTLSVKSGHEGDYACQAELKGRTVTTAKSKTYSLTVHGSKPTVLLKQDPPYPEIYTREQVKLICTIKEKTSKWQYQWQKHSVLVNSSTYTILNATLDQKGEYNCSIKRREMTYANSTKLNIREPPQPKLSIESEWKTFYPTEKVILKCSIDGGSNEWSYEWFRKSTPISVDEDISFSGNTLSISSAKASHSGQYTCRGKHLMRTPVTTRQAEALKLNIYVNTTKPDITKHQWFEFFTEEEVHLGCNMPGDGWEFHWYKKSKPLIAKPNYTIKSASLSDTGVYHCKAKRGDFSVDSETLQVQVEARPAAVLSLETELSDIISGNSLTLRCNISDGRQWSYAWFKNGQKLNELSHMFKVRATEETIKSEFKCKGIRTERPLYSALSEGFTANNIILKRKILLAISGCLVCCIIILIIGCLVLKFTRKPGKKETIQDDLFFSMADSKNQTASPLEEYMDNSPTEMEECEEKEELLTDHVSAVDEDDVIKDEDSPAAEANGLTSFKGL
ncbi:Fc receptor-like protein 5 [Chanodichthys erythropterus]|uniref:Fc receptor-like protein 5 n=1 Tax=Chanodichthys erythropterus TaxID=933992 RepID=UPI00351EDDBC